jgi:hypothetical protein
MRQLTLNMPNRRRRGRHRWERKRLVSVLSAGVLLGGSLAAIVTLTGPSSAQIGLSSAQAGSVPPAPPGWTTVFSDNFGGAAGAAPALDNWFYDIGSGTKYQMGEVDRTTRSTENVFLDGSGHLVLKATRSGSAWTSGRIESTRDDFTAPAGGQLEMTASIELPIAFLMDGKVVQKITEANRGTATWKAAIHHGFFIIVDLAVGGTFPNAACGCTTPKAATTSGASMKLGYVAVYEKGGNSTPTAKPTATGRITGYNGWCLDNRNSQDTTANVIDAVSCGSSTGQKWSVYSDNTLRTKGGCLGYWGTSAVNGAFADWYPCNGAVGQKWVHQSSGEFVNPASGLCLSVPPNGKGVQLTLQTCTDSAPQRWTSL